MQTGYGSLTLMQDEPGVPGEVMQCLLWIGNQPHLQY